MRQVIQQGVKTKVLVLSATPVNKRFGDLRNQLALAHARSRKHIQAFYDTSDIGAFPERLPPESIRSPLTGLVAVPTFAELYERLSSLTLAVYAPLAYVFPSRLEKYERLYGNVTAGLNTAGRGRVEPLAGQP